VPVPLVDCATLGGLAALRSLVLAGVRVGGLPHLRRLGGLQRLSLLDAEFVCEAARAGAGASIPEALEPLRSLRRLSITSSVLAEPGAAPLRGLSRLRGLRGLHLGGTLGVNDAVCAEVAALRGLKALELEDPRWWTRSAPGAAATDAGVAALAAGLRHSLTRLVVRGQGGVTAAALPSIGAIRCLQELDLQLVGRGAADVAPPPPPDAAAPADDGALRPLAPLRLLHTLKLGGCAVGEGGCRVLAALPLLTRLELHDCALPDAGVFHLKALPLRALRLRGCPAVTDIALAALAKSARGLTLLDLSGCHRNVTDTGVAALGALPALRDLGLAHCGAVGDAALRALLTRGGRRLETLDLGDCAVGDPTCAALAALAPALRVLGLEHCARVGDAGALLLARAPRLEEVRLRGSGVTPGGAAALAAEAARRRGPGRARVRVCLAGRCWWEGGGPGGRRP
jgi:hypothetical protein